MRISDWSSDVCSSDLKGGPDRFRTSVQPSSLGFDCQAIDVLLLTSISRSFRLVLVPGAVPPTTRGDGGARGGLQQTRIGPGDDIQRQIGSASCRDRVCKYV